MHTRCLLFVLLSIAVSRPLAGAESSRELANRYLIAVERVKSYDAVLRIETLAYPDFTNLQKPENAHVVASTEQVRDVLAVGLGRRAERSLEDKTLHSMAVIDWSTAVSSGRSLSKNLAFALPGMGYSDYFNPDCWGTFLSDLVRQPESDVRLLEPSPAHPSTTGFELDSSRLRGPVRVRLDPRRGYMPVSIERHFRQNGRTSLWDRTEVQEFLEAGEGVWVPAKASLITVAPEGPTAGRAYLGFVMAVDAKQSKWNSVRSADLFQASSLPAVNNQERGWKQYYPAAVLPAVEAANKVRQSMEKPPGLSRPRIAFITANVFVILVVLAVVARRKFFKRPPPASA